MNFIEKTALTADKQKLLEDLEFVLKICPFAQTGQLGLNYRPGSENVWYDAVGSLYDYEKKQYKANESDFTEWNKQIPSYTTDIIQNLKEKFNFKLGRVRYMRLKPKTGLSVHNDRETRFHIVLQTNPKSYVLLAEDANGCNVQGWHIPDDNHFYKIDTTREHFVYNGGNTDRIHLVICALPNS